MLSVSWIQSPLTICYCFCSYQVYCDNKIYWIFFFFFFKKPGYSLLEVLFTVLGTVSRSSSHQSTFSKVTFFRFLHGDLNPLSVLGSLAKQLTFINSFAYEPQETDAQSSQCVKNSKACGFPGFVLKCCRCWIVL